MAKIYNTRTCTHTNKDECKICDEYEKTKIYNTRTCTHTKELEQAVDLKINLERVQKQYTSDKHQASSSQATSHKPQAPSESSNKPQASSPKHKGSSFKPQASSAKTPDPGKSFTAPEPRCWTKIKLFCGCFLWKAI